MPANDGNLMMRDAKILFRNFAGKEGMYNAEGDRNFCVLLDPVTAQQMREDGWNVKQLRPKEEGAEPQDYLQVSIKYRGRNGAQVRPPIIVLVASKGRVSLSEEECEIIDYVDIAKVDLIVRPFEWAVNGKSGIKAYLKSIYVTMDEDELMIEYGNVPEARGGLQALESGRVDEDEDIIDAESWDIDEDQRAITA